jgi:RNA polymerase-binding transcription factor
MKDKHQERLDRYRPRVIEELSNLGGLMETSAEDSRPVQLDQQSVGRLARMDAMQWQAMASETQRRRQNRRAQLLQTLKRMDDNEFGYCVNCGEEIPDGRLNIDPTFHLCVKCAD